MPAEPLSIAEKLIQEILDFQMEFKKITTLERLKLISQVDSLAKSIPEYDYHDFLGMIFCLENDKKLAIQHHKSALEKAPESFMVHHNYFASLSAFGLFKKAREFGDVILSKFPVEAKNFKTIETMVTNLLVSGRLEDSHNLLNKLENPMNYENYGVITELLPVFRAAGITDDEAEKIHDSIFHVLHEKELHLSNIGIKVIDNCLVITIYVELPIEDIFELNWDAAGVLAESVEDMRSNVIMFEFSSVDVFLEKEGKL
jgi:tetratricopeptide (TPR) repeat protein